MPKIDFLYISEKKVKANLAPRTAIRMIERSLRTMNVRSTQMPPKIYIRPPKGDFRAMPAYAHTPHQTAGIKWVSVFLGNKNHAKPTVMGTILLNNPRTGELLSVLQANTITALRTGAVATVASKVLASSKSRVLTLVGAGVQSEYQLRCHLECFKFKTIYVWSPFPKETRQFVKRHRTWCRGLTVGESLEPCVREADILSTCTPTRKPLICKNWIKPGAHINAMGADAPGKQELDPQILKQHTVFVDDLAQAMHSGEVNVPLTLKQISRKHIRGTLTQALRGYRRKSREITIFDSTGLAIHDIVLADYLYRTLKK